MIHVIIGRQEPRDAADMARRVYLELVAAGLHVILDTPGDFRTNMPERRLSAAEILVTGRQLITTNNPLRIAS